MIFVSLWTYSKPSPTWHRVTMPDWQWPFMQARALVCGETRRFGTVCDTKRNKIFPQLGRYRGVTETFVKHCWQRCTRGSSMHDVLERHTSWRCMGLVPLTPGSMEYVRKSLSARKLYGSMKQVILCWLLAQLCMSCQTRTLKWWFSWQQCEGSMFLEVMKRARREKSPSTGAPCPGTIHEGDWSCFSPHKYQTKAFFEWWVRWGRGSALKGKRMPW